MTYAFVTPKVLFPLRENLYKTEQASPREFIPFRDFYLNKSVPATHLNNPTNLFPATECVPCAIPDK